MSKQTPDEFVAELRDKFNKHVDQFIKGGQRTDQK